MDALRFASIILTLATRYQFSVTSWGRSVERNASTGGHVNSRHLSWEAVDVVLDKDKDRESFISSAQRLSLKVVEEKECIHLQTP